MYLELIPGLVLAVGTANLHQAITGASVNPTQILKNPYIESEGTMRRETNFVVAACHTTELRLIIRKALELRRLLLVFILCFAPSLAEAVTYYVSPNGSDSNRGKADAPFRTINAALHFIGTAPGAGAGAIVEVAGGTYNETLILNLPSGTSWDQPFTLQAKAGDVVTITGDGEANVYIADGIDYYSIINGFIFDGMSTWRSQVIIGSCCDPQPGYIRFQNNEFINNTYGGFFIDGHNVEILDNKIHGGFQEFWGCGQGHCFGYAFYVTSGNNLFDGNEIYDVSSWAFHIYNHSNFEDAHDNIVRNNIIHDFGYGDERANGILASSGADNQIYDNIVYNGTNGIGVGAGCNDCQVRNNRISNMNRCLEVLNSTDAIVQDNILSNCGQMYFNISGNTAGLVMSDNSCDQNNCAALGR